MRRELGVGEPAPKLELPTETGEMVSLESLHGRAVLVSFLSHAAWPFSRVHLVEVIKRREEIEGLGAEVLLVAYDERTLLSAKMLHNLALPFPLLLDRTRKTYARWGMGRTGLTGAMLSPSLNWRYLKLLAKGERFLGFAPDMFQLGGDFLVDKQGTLVFAHRMRNNGDRADTGTLLDGLARAADGA